MDRSIHKNKFGNWEMPLPFRASEVYMPNNRSQAVNRLNNLLCSFKRRRKLEKDYFDFMARTPERVPNDELKPDKGVSEEKEGNAKRSGQIWYLPHFGVYHPKKPEQVRVVFDSSADYKGMSLNKQLLAGPDQMNSLIGVLLRFRQDNVAATCDVEQMFHSFHVNQEHRDFLRFLWFKDNDASKEIIEYRMVVHLFGNVSSPATATFGMRRTADDGEEEFGTEVKEFVHNDFYVDDGLTSRPTDKQMTELIKSAQAMLATANLRLHKVASNSVDIMEALPSKDWAKNM